MSETGAMKVWVKEKNRFPVIVPNGAPTVIFESARIGSQQSEWTNAPAAGSLQWS